MINVSARSDQDISDAYLYLLGRLLVLRQEHLDFCHNGFEWNVLSHREPALDGVCSETWMAVGEHGCTVIEIPPLAGRSFTIRTTNGWGETTSRVGERTHPGHPHGKFAYCLVGARVRVPQGAVRVDLPNQRSRCVITIGAGADLRATCALQRQMTIHTAGKPIIAAPLDAPLLTTAMLPGAEAFDVADPVLHSEPDLNPSTAPLQEKVRAVAATVGASVDERRRVDGVIRYVAWPTLKRKVASMGLDGIEPTTADSHGDWLMRTAANLGGSLVTTLPMR